MNQKTTINRLILLGNGFDLAHGLKTTYNDFIIWYLVQAMENASMHINYTDELMTIKSSHFYAINYLYQQGLDKVPNFVNYFYHHGFSQMIRESELRIDGWNNSFANPFTFKFHSDLLVTLLLTCSHANWVDIENMFYEHLKEILKNKELSEKEAEIAKLNNSLKFIIDKLETYLSNLDVSAHKAGYEEIINSAFESQEFVGMNAEEKWHAEVDQTMILNFNYTSTIENYLDDKNIHHSHIVLNYIHGKIGDEKNRLIFGFGDELDQDYAGFELAKTKGIFEYIKSFWYFRTSNYHNLIRFIDSAPYQIYILGHSCGLSDRTMLNMVFENDNCKSIKIFYYQAENSNNYTAITQEIARHFKDKQGMRRKIVPFDKSSPMPQFVA